MYGYIYRTTNIINGKIYIGKHKSAEFDPNYKGSGSALWNAINKYGWSAFHTEMLSRCFSLEELNEEEIMLIAHFNATDRSIGYNLLDGGDGGSLYGELNSFYGKHHTKETRGIISSVLRASWQDEDYRNRQHESRLGNQNSAGTIWIHKGDINHRANLDNIENYLVDGWELGCSLASSEKKRLAAIGRQNNLGKVRIHKGELGRMVDRSQLELYLESGWELGMKPSATRSRLGRNAPPNRRYHVTCKVCGKQFLGTSPKSNKCPECKGGDT